MNANSPKPKHVFMLVNQNYGHPNPWALIAERQKDWLPHLYLPMASFATKAEAIACLKYCIAVAEMDDAS
jgi:hypothetical protein